MANSTKEIKRRIRSITNIGQITKAMELVSAAKMRKAQATAIASRPYATLSSQLLNELVAKVNLSKHPLLNKVIPVGNQDKVQKVLIILISSDRGLAGAFNTNVINKALDIVKKEGADKIDFVTTGKKGSDTIVRLRYNIVASFPGKDKNITSLDAEPIAVMATDDFIAGKYEKVFVVYTNFISTLVQKPAMIQLLPFESKQAANSKQQTDLLFEPSSDEILETLIDRTIKFTVYQALVEAAASEHSARMVAMRNANEAAGDLLNELSLSYNQARQAGITRELSEISAAKLAMEG